MHGLIRSLINGNCNEFTEEFEYFLDSCPSFLHSVGKDRFFPAFFFGMFATAFDSGTADNNEKIFFRFDNDPNGSGRGNLKVAVLNNKRDRQGCRIVRCFTISDRENSYGSRFSEVERQQVEGMLHGELNWQEYKTFRIENLQKQLESKSKELNGKNEKFLGASTHIKRQGNYASVSNAPFLIAGALASLILLTSGVFTVAPYVAFLAPIAALGVALPVTLTLFVLSAVVIALSYKIISQNKRFDVKEIELNEKNRLAKEQENTIKNLETKIKEQGSTHQVLVHQCLKKDLELMTIKEELENLKNEQAQKNDRCYHSVHNTPTTFSDSLSPGSTLNGAVEHLGPYKENQKRQTEATREGQNQKRRLISPDLGINSMSLEDDSLSEDEDIASLTSSVEGFETAARGRSSSLSSTGGSNNDQPGPSNKLDGVQPISHSRSLDSLHSNNGDIRKSQCR